jgi:hypothetical protein
MYVQKYTNPHIYFIKFKAIKDYVCQYYKQNMF